MPNYIRHDGLALAGSGFPAPAIEPLTGLRPFVAHPALAVFRAQDHVAAQSGRIVCSWGLRGDGEWRVPNTDPNGAISAAQTHPNRTTWYVVARARADLTPGCFLELHGAFVPSGETQHNVPVGPDPQWVPDGAQGSVRVTIVWTDRAAATETTVHELALPGSTLEFGAEDQGVAGLWRTLREFGPIIMAPPGVPDDTAELARWCRSVTAEITVEVQGSPRVVDATITEIPVALALDIDDAADDAYAVSHLFAPGSPNAPVPVPRYSFSRWALRALVTARAQARVLGPALFDWTAYSEASATATATIAARTTANDGTTFESLLNSVHTGTGPGAYSADLPGWAVSCGGYARRWSTNNVLVLRDRIAVIPVLFSVYGRGITAGTSTVRVQTALHSFVDVVLPVAGSADWHHACGYLEVGINPEQPVIAQVFLNHLGASGSLSVEAVSLSHLVTPAA